MKVFVYIFLMGCLGLFCLTACQWDLDRINPADLNPNRNFVCGDSNWVDVRDGKSYRTVFIGTQCWFGENINVGVRINQGIFQSEDGRIEKHCYEDDPALCDKYGGLYTFTEAFQGIHKDSSTGKTIIPDDSYFIQGICPEGWHISSDDEWIKLERALQMPENELNTLANRGSSVYAANKLKALSDGNCANTTPPNPTPPDCGISGFDGLLAGYISDKISIHKDSRSFWWTSTPRNSSFDNQYMVRIIKKESLGIDRGYNAPTGKGGFSVRCIKDRL